MIFSFAIISIALIAMYLILCRFGKEVFESGHEVIAATPLLSIAYIAAATSIFLLVFSTAWSGFLALLSLVIIGIFSFWNLHREKKTFWIKGGGSSKKALLHYAQAAILAIFLSALILASFSKLKDGSFLISGVSTVDTPYHLSQIMRIGITERWDFEEPNFSGEFIRYPYFINLISGLLLKSGLPLEFSFHIPLILLSFSGMFLFVLFFSDIGFSRVGNVFGTLGALFGSGVWYASAQNVSYPALIPGFLVVQRPFLLGFGLFILAFMFFFRGVRKESRRCFLWAGIVAGILPFSHTHSFVALALATGSAVLVLMILRFDLFLKAVRYFVYPSFVFAIPQLAIFMLLPKFPLVGAMDFRLGWMMSAGPVGGLNSSVSGFSKLFLWLRFMLTNFGFLLLLPVALVRFFSRVLKNHSLAVTAIGALALWIIPNLIQFQIWDYDSNKFFSYAILLSIAAIGGLIYSPAFLAGKYIEAIFVVIIIISLPHALAASFNRLSNYQDGGIIIFTEAERKASDWIIKNTPASASFLSSAALVSREALQNPVIVGAGRKSEIGFITWLFTHGIDFTDRLEEVTAFFNDPENNKTSADYLLIDNLLRQKYPDLEVKVKKAGYKMVYEDPQYPIIQLFTP